MGNRFATISQYHNIVVAHGVLATIVFLFIVPAAVMIARFYARRPGFARRYHAYLQVLSVGLITVVFILGWFAVGPNRSLTNPHHGIGVAIYVLILLQAIGGRMVKHIDRRRSFRLTIHRWSGRAIALLGIVQIPLGLTLYGSPKFTFVLFTLWMVFLLLLYFVLDYRDDRHRDDRVEVSHTHRGRSAERKSGSSKWKWLGPLAAGAGALAFMRRRNKSRSRSRSHDRATARARSRSRPPEVIPSRRGSDSYVETEKYSSRRRASGGGGGGFMGKVAAAGAAVGAGALLSKFMGRNKNRDRDEEYSAVATDTPSRRSRLHRSRTRRHGTVVSDYSEGTEFTRGGRRSPLLPGPGGVTVAAAALSAAEGRRGTHGNRPPRPVTPQPSHRRGDSRVETVESDYSPYRSPSRRTPAKTGGGVGKGLLAGLGLGWLGKKAGDRRDRHEEERLRHDDEERRGGARPPRYTGDGYPSPARRESQRRRERRPPPAVAPTVSALSDLSSSVIEPRSQATAFGGPPMPPLVSGGLGGPPGPPGMGPRSRSISRHDVVEPAVMPAMPPDPQGVLHHESGSETYMSSGGHPHRRPSARRRREGEAAAVAAAATAGRLAAEEQQHRRTDRGPERTPPSQPVSVKVKVHDDRDRNVTLRRLTEEEAAAARRDQRRRPADSSSSLSEPESPSRRRYRRDSSMRRAELEAERRVDDAPLAPEPLPPPNPAFAGGRRPKDSAYYSGQPGPSGGMAAAGHTVSSIGSPDSHGTWSGLGPSPSGALKEPTASAADRRRRRRLERRDTQGASAAGGAVDFT